MLALSRGTDALGCLRIPSLPSARPRLWLNTHCSSRAVISCSPSRPQVLAACTNPLTQLSLSGSGSSQAPPLPPGPYLSGLQVLKLSWSLARLPPVLAAATQLRSLDLSDNFKLRIALVDVMRVLSPLQRLTELRLSSWGGALDPRAAARLFRALPSLQSPDSWGHGW